MYLTILQRKIWALSTWCKKLSLNILVWNYSHIKQKKNAVCYEGVTVLLTAIFSPFFSLFYSFSWNVILLQSLIVMQPRWEIYYCWTWSVLQISTRFSTNALVRILRLKSTPLPLHQMWTEYIKEWNLIAFRQVSWYFKCVDIVLSCAVPVQIFIRYT